MLSETNKRKQRTTDGYSKMASILEQRNNAEITIRSVLVLGFNLEDYTNNFPTIGVGLEILNVNSFVAKNSKALLVVLHFLLIMLDTEAFCASITYCFPYRDINEKNEFRHCILKSLERLVDRGLLPADLVRASLLLQAQGNEVWLLLRALTDVALDHAITTMTAAQGGDTENSLVAAINSLTSVEDLHQQIEEEFMSVRQTVLKTMNRQACQKDYMEELDNRIKQASVDIEDIKRNISEMLQGDHAHVFTQVGREQRAAIMAQLDSSKVILQALADSALLVKASELAEENKARRENGLLVAAGMRIIDGKSGSVEGSDDKSLQSSVTFAPMSFIREIDVLIESVRSIDNAVANSSKVI